MLDAKPIGQQFLDALAANDPARFADILDEMVGMRIGGWRGSEFYRPRERVVQRLIDEWSAWGDPTLEVFSIVGEGDRVALEFRIQATENGCYVEHNRSAFFQIAEGKVQTIDLYCPEPLPSARRKGWIAPPTLTRVEMNQLFDSFMYAHDLREWIAPNTSFRYSLRGGYGGSYTPHPGANSVGGVQWSAEEADARIEETIAHFRERDCGFNWIVSPTDQPADLRERLERHGVALAGDEILMARVGLERLDDIRTNPELEIEIVDGSKDEPIEAALQIIASAFNWPADQVAERRQGFFERARDQKLLDTEIAYLGSLNGEPVATARLQFRVGVAYLGGAATLREYRGRRIYSTLLKRRLEDARARGYHISAIHAEPMSRRVVSKYGFQEYARFYRYAWMPVMDMSVIKSLVPDE